MLRVVEAFSGIGSQAKALEKLGIDYKILNTIEWDITACYAYDVIHNGKQDLSEYKNYDKEDILRFLSNYVLSMDGKEATRIDILKKLPLDTLKHFMCAMERTNNLGSITEVHEKDLPKKIDLLTYSFPCQDLSISGAFHGNMTGIDRTVHNRSGMLWEVERILNEFYTAKRRMPKFLLMENVSNILSSTHKGNFKEWEDFLQNLGYFNRVYTLDASNFGSPQKRVRTYMLSVYCPSESKRKLVEKYFRKNNLEEVRSSNQPCLELYLKTDYSIEKYKKEADESNMNDTPSRRKIYKDNEVVFDGKKCITKTIKTLTTKQDRNPTCGLVIYPDHKPGKSIYRNITPRECFLFMGFDEDDYEALVENDISYNSSKTIYTRERKERLAGNSIVVEVLIAIFSQVIDIKTILWH